MTSTRIYGVEETEFPGEEEEVVDDDPASTAAIAMATSSTSSHPPLGPIYYFAYGPIVNPMVRRRRGLKTSEEQAAILPGHRLTFSYGGLAEVIPQRGYEVHGIVMKVQPEDWKDFQAYDKGYNQMDRVAVIPYDTSSSNNISEAIQAVTMTMKDFDQSKLDSPIEQLPTERYLKLIRHGFRFYNVDPDYIEDQIMGVPYSPSRRPEDCERYPQITTRLPKLTWPKYQKLCQETSEIYFALNHKVLRLESLEPGRHYDPNHPAVLWMKERCHGCRELAWVMHQTIVEPDLPLVDRYEDITPEHVAWAENDSIEFLRKNHLTAVKVFDLVSSESSCSSTWCSRLASICQVASSGLGCNSRNVTQTVVVRNNEHTPNRRLRHSRSPSTSSELLQQEDEFRILRSVNQDPDGNTVISNSSQ